MSSVVLIDPTTGEENTKFPEYLGKCAKLAANSHHSGSASFTCPNSGKTLNVSMIQDKEKIEPGVEMMYQGTLWQCWSGGLTQGGGKEFFKVRAKDPTLFAFGKNGISNKPCVKAYGNLFINVTSEGATVYKMSLRGIASSAKQELAEALEEAGVVSLEQVTAVDKDVTIPETTRVQRTSSVTLGS